MNNYHSSLFRFFLLSVTVCAFQSKYHIKSSITASTFFTRIVLKNTDAPSSHESKAQFFSNLLSRFQGDFDNYRQVLSDRRKGLYPRESGGHEHFHCSLLPIPHSLLPPNLFGNTDNNYRGAVLASYYLDGMPQRVFRLRLYTFEGNEGENDIGVKMKLFLPNSELEGKLKETSNTAIESWNLILSEYLEQNKGNSNQEDALVELKRCDILWSNVPHPIRHSYLPQEEKGYNVDSSAYHAIMIYDHEKGGVRLKSQMIPGTYIHVQDELSLWEDELWINDRGFTSNGERVYGNWRDVPYKMQRLTNVIIRKSGLQFEWERKNVDPSISWTLGDEWRTKDEYDSKMTAIGGVSSRIVPKDGTDKRNIINEKN